VHFSTVYAAWRQIKKTAVGSKAFSCAFLNDGFTAAVFFFPDGQGFCFSGFRR
jgi:hypothetical protein